ncbi:Bromodomain containing protein [Tritrichomonas foetus]|uniref:Bromodomain containing protein n=1 Tax=Tritrichomonas foetus TaxID=1144522 RepID=A0A1J4JHH9_9EUKA|nr:Bromodomain containing protein [Tritrichomonas foetus]|eukprot:OHS96941.1 Bromodomain containing protein [Tritrichomonas foetus]
MDEYTKKKCLSIMEKLEKHPIAQMFAEPVDPIRDEAPNYFKIIKKPMDFSTVKEKLRNNKYPTTHLWKEEIQLIFSNALTYNGKSSTVGIVATELHHKFKELSKSITDNPNSSWYNELTSLRKKLIDHVQLRSATVFGHSLSSMNAQKQPPTPSESSCEVRRFEVNVMKRGELEQLARNLDSLVEPNQLDHIAQIIQKQNPEVDTTDGTTIDLNILTPQTLRKLKEYAIEEIEKRGEKY